MSDTGVLVLECIDKSDPDTEGDSYLHMFNLMDVKSQYSPPPGLDDTQLVE